nr:transposase domain-containing protein [Salipiger profundus]
MTATITHSQDAKATLTSAGHPHMGRYKSASGRRVMNHDAPTLVQTQDCLPIDRPHLGPQRLPDRHRENQWHGALHAYLKATLEAIAAGHPASRIYQLLPWNFTPSS